MTRRFILYGFRTATAYVIGLLSVSFLPSLSSCAYRKQLAHSPFSFKKIIITFCIYSPKNNIFVENNIITPIFGAIYNFMPNLMFLGSLEMLGEMLLFFHLAPLLRNNKIY